MLLTGWQEGHQTCKKLSGGCWHSYLFGVRFRFAYIWSSWCHCHSLPLASVKCRLVLVPAHRGNLRTKVQWAVKWMHVYKCRS